MMEEIRLEEIGAGEKKVLRCGIAHLLEGSDLSLALHVIRGAAPGPTLSIISLLHGDEWQTFEIVRRFVDTLNPRELKGTILALPVANPIALANRVRTTRGSPDAPDLNQVFPGGPGWFTQLIARSITENVLEKSDYLIDLHGRWWGSNVEQLNFYEDHPNEKVNEASRRMALHSGIHMLHETSIRGSMPSPRNCFGYATGVLEVPSIMVELGGLGYGDELENAWIERGVQVIRNVMIACEMLEGEFSPSGRVLLYPSEAVRRVAASAGGYFEPAIDPNPLFREVGEGQLMGRVIDPHTFQVLEELEAPAAGIVYLLSRGNMIHPGEWGFALIDMSHPETRWVER
jgi:predicted deacylase